MIHESVTVGLGDRSYDIIVGTGLVRTTVSSSTGVFTLPDLPLGNYTVDAVIEGFQPQRAAVEVSVSRVTSADFKMGLSQLTEVVNVSAAAVTLDIQSTALASVIQPKQVQELPLNGRDFRGMLQLAPGVAGTSVNGVRTRGNNFQIDGADNNDAFQNTAAVNQGGVSGIAGTLLGAVGRAGGNGAQRRLHREPRHQVGHQRLSRQRLLLQP